VLAIRRFALLDKSLKLIKLSTNRKIQCGNSCRRTLTLFKLFVVILLYIWCGNAHACSHKFWYGVQTTTKSQHLTPLVFKASSNKRAFVLRSFYEQLCSDLSRKTKSIFIELASLKSLYLVKFHFGWKSPFARKTSL